MKINDLILIALLLMLSLMPLIFHIESNKKIADIKLNGNIIRQIELSEDKTFVIDSENGSNVVDVKDGKIAIIEADCPDKVCVKTGAISNMGEIIACVPHKLVILIHH